MNGTLALIESLISIKGTNQKQDFLRENRFDDDFCKFLYYALNPMLTYKLSEKTMRRLSSGADNTYKSRSIKDIFTICDQLSERKALDNVTVESVCSFLRECSADEKELYIKLLAKKLRLGVTAKTVNNIIPNLIPVWEVQQAYPIDEYPIKQGSWFTITQKLNGVRATYYKGKLYARSGVPFSGLEHILNEFEWDSNNDFVFDGELTLADRTGISDNEAFRMATGIINSDGDKTGICYTIFDIVNTKEFENDNCVIPYSGRRIALESVAEKFSDRCVRVLPVLYMGTDQSKISELLEVMVAEDKEGLMVNLDIPYKRKRHRGILKVKRFYTMDLPIIGFEEGSGRLSNTLGAIIVDYKGSSVGVGSGLSDEQRRKFWEMRSELLGMLCEVKYKDISKDKTTGKESLQFPCFVSIRQDKTEISYG